MHKKYLLFLVYGASGAGKSTLLRIAAETNKNVTVHKKDTTRKPRKGEDIKQGGTFDLNFVSELANKENYEVIYRKFDCLYGIRKDQLVKAFENKEIHFVIVNDIDAIKELKSFHPEAKILYVHVHPLEIPKNIQKREGVSFNERTERIKQSYMEYIENNTLFDYTLVNFWDVENTHRQLQNIIRSFF